MTAVALFAFPSAAMAAEELIPPGNSAVNQYTETFPTPGGDKDAGKENKGRRPTPAKVLGQRNTERLEEHGRQGREVADLAAATAPETTVPEPVEAGGGDDGDGGAAGGGNRGGGGRGGDKAPAQPQPAPQKPRVAAPPPSGSDGSSGLSEVIAQATGSSSSGGIGLLLPLAIAAAAVWSIAYLRRRNRGTAQ